MKQSNVDAESEAVATSLENSVERRRYGAHSIVFASHVSIAHRSALEMLVYFNAAQDRVAQGIVDAVERFGAPEIACDGDRLRIRMAGLADAQSLFALDAETGRPVGVAVYARPDLQNMLIVHVGVAAEFAVGGKRAHEQLLLKMLRELHRCSRRIKGVERIELPYAAARTRHARRPAAAAYY
jgi:hypothetical protein